MRKERLRDIETFHPLVRSPNSLSRLSQTREPAALSCAFSVQEAGLKEIQPQLIDDLICTVGDICGS